MSSPMDCVCNVGCWKPEFIGCNLLSGCLKDPDVGFGVVDRGKRTTNSADVNRANEPPCFRSAWSTLLVM